MDAKRAAEVLENLAPWTHHDAKEGCEIGAQALEAWAWVERTGELPYHHGDRWAALGKDTSGHWVFGQGPTPLLAVLDAMEKEGKG